MQVNDLIASYEAISVITGDMLIAAQSGDWDRLTNLERHCRAAVDRVKNVSAGLELNSQDHLRRREVIRKILADDARIRDLTQPRLAKLMQLLRGSDASRKVARTYEDGLGL